MDENQKQHEMIARLKDLALEMGRTPTIMEADAKGISKYYINRHFGGMTPFVHAAGLTMAKQRKIDSSIFEKSIEKQIEEYTPRDDVKPYVIEHPNAKIAIISDIHWPFSSKKVIDAFYAFIKEHQPDFVIINGDAWDCYSHSKYPRSHNIYTPREEQNLARRMNEEFWAKVRELCPDARCFHLLGNHDVRPLKRVLEDYPEAEDWIAEKLRQLFTFSGVETIHDPRQELQINDDLIFHGYRSKLGDHMNYTLMNCHNGHTHHAGVVFRRIKGKTLFESNSGVAGDIEAKAMSYTSQKMTTQTPGFSYRDRWGPRFIAV
jgi:predicted phosphodiesterase